MLPLGSEEPSKRGSEEEPIDRQIARAGAALPEDTREVLQCLLHDGEELRRRGLVDMSDMSEHFRRVFGNDED